MLVSSMTALVLAEQLMIVLHEGAHTVAGLAFGLRPTQYTGAVAFVPEPAGATGAAIALAGPVFSLVTGLALIALGTRRSGSWWRLLVMWFAFVSVMEFVGYLMTAPFVPFGDIGSAIGALGLPDAVAWVCFVAGLAGMVLLARRFAPAALRWARDLYELRAMVVWAWLYGAIIVSALTVAYLTASSAMDAATATFIVMGAIAVTVFSPLSMSFSTRAYARIPDADRPHGPAPAVPIAGWVALAAIVAVNLFVLAPGLRIG